MAFQIPSHRNSVNRTRERRGSWRELVRSIPAKSKPEPKPARKVQRTPVAAFAAQLPEHLRQPEIISFACAACEINDRVSFHLIGEWSVSDSIDAILESGATVYTKKAAYRMVGD